jgi:acyl-lipid omega-6 desaturase (Delta-12 desaturase)
MSKPGQAPERSLQESRADERSADQWLDDGGSHLGKTAPPTANSDAGHQFWRNSIAPHEQPSLPRSLFDLATSVVPYLALTVAMYLSLSFSVWITLALAVPAAGFLLRTFIVFHDCAHGSFLSNRRANLWLGRFTGLLVFQPFGNWRHKHAVHHGTAGDLDRRGTGDVMTLTIEEYTSSSLKQRLGYRLFRNPLVMFGLGPIWSLMIGPRFWSRKMRPRQRRSVIEMNLVLVIIVGAIVWFVGLQAWLLVQVPTAVLAGTLGGWMFYVQHQFEDVYWESSERWTYAAAALRGSSYLRLPKVFQFFSGNIGLHHVHHLSAKVPNYNLQRAHDEIAIFHDVPVLTFRDGLRSIRLKVIDPNSGRLLTWNEVKSRA